MNKLFGLLFLVLGLQAEGQNRFYLLIGTYTTGNSEGIYVYDFQTEHAVSGRLHVARGIRNPSYLAISPDNKYVYAVSEIGDADKGGRVFAYAFDPRSGTLRPLSNQPSGGDDPCYVAVDDAGQWVIAGNYSSGTVKAMRSRDGVLEDNPVVIRHSGSGPNKERQEKPHVHSTLFSKDNRFLYVADLGIDQVMTYAFRSGDGALVKVSSVSVEPGGGPRHMDIHPNGRFAYVLEELKGRVSVYGIDESSGAWTWIESVPSTAAGFSGFAGSADIHVSGDGKFLYASNRGDANDIAIFSVNRRNGRLRKMGHQPVLGVAPRNFTLDPSGRYLLVANMKSDQVVIFERNRRNGKLKDTGKRIDVPTPVCLKWIPAG